MKALGMLCPVYNLVVTRNRWLILLSKILLSSNLEKFHQKILKFVRIPILCLIFYVASVVVELVAILC
jgi:hypothetical protein